MAFKERSMFLGILSTQEIKQSVDIMTKLSCYIKNRANPQNDQVNSILNELFQQRREWCYEK